MKVKKVIDIIIVSMAVISWSILIAYVSVP